MGNFHISYFGRVSLRSSRNRSPPYRRQKSRLLPLYPDMPMRYFSFELAFSYIECAMWQLVSLSRFHAVEPRPMCQFFIHLFLYCIQSNVQMPVAHAYADKKKKRNFKLCVVWPCVRVSVSVVRQSTF